MVRRVLDNTLHITAFHELCDYVGAGFKPAPTLFLSQIEDGDNVRVARRPMAWASREMRVWETVSSASVPSAALRMGDGGFGLSGVQRRPTIATEERSGIVLPLARWTYRHEINRALVAKQRVIAIVVATVRANHSVP